MAAGEALIEVENVSKKFCKDLKRSLWYGVRDFAYELSGGKPLERRLRPDEFWSLRDVSFQVRRGECLGLIGPNGAGKTTLLRILNGLIKPDAGKIVTCGRIGALISVGAGFIPILTGRENIYATGALYGFTTDYINRTFDEIVSFSGLEEFIDMPVQNYSSGMQVRLGFSIATKMDTDILILDEVLAVGDMEFRSKCYAYLSEAMNTRAVIIVSHSMPQIGRLANIGMTLQKGRVEYFGNTNDAIQHYYRLFPETTMSRRTGSGDLKIADFNVRDSHGENIDSVNTARFGEPLIFSFGIQRFNLSINRAHLSIVIFDMNGTICMECTTSFQDHVIEIDGEYTTQSARIDRLQLAQGRYRVSLVLRSVNETEIYDWLHHVIDFVVSSKNQGGAPVQMLASWSS